MSAKNSQAGLRLDSDMFSCALAAWTKAGLLDQGVEVLARELRDGHAPPDPPLFAALLCACGDLEVQDHHKLAEQVVEAMQHVGITPDAESYGVLVMVIHERDCLLLWTSGWERRRSSNRLRLETSVLRLPFGHVRLA